MALPTKPSPEEVEEHFRNLLDREGISQPDEVEHDLAAGELLFRWYEQKVVIVIELSENGPVDVRSGVPMPPV
jgi:hypothetical protein